MITNYIGDNCAADLLSCPLPRTNVAVQVPVDPTKPNSLLPPAPEEVWGLGDAWGGVTELSETHNDVMLVRAGAYVSTGGGGLFRRRLQGDSPALPVYAVERGKSWWGDPIFGLAERDVVLKEPRG